VRSRIPDQAILAVVAVGMATACTLLVDTDGFAGNDDAGARDAASDDDRVAMSEAGLEQDGSAAIDASTGEACPPSTAADPTLLAWYPFEEDDATTARITDCSGRGHGGALVGAPSGFARVPGKVGARAIDLLGGSSCFDVGLAKEIVFPLTVTAWVRPRSLSLSDGSPRFLLGRVDSTDTGWNVGTDLVGNLRRLEVKARKGSSGIIETEMDMPPGTDWVHVAGVFQATTIRIYVNGVPKDAISHDAKAAAESAHLFVGCRLPANSSVATHTAFFDGAVDDLRIYSRVLERTEIEVLAR
jgi:hypothetical protein